MTTQSYEVKKDLDNSAISHEVVAAVAKKVAPTSTEQLPVVITEERTKLGLFEIGLLPFLYLEKFIQVMYDAITTRINSRR